MSVWTDPIIIPPLQIIIFILGFLVNKIIDKKAGKNLSDLERINYVGDKLVDTSVMHGKKVKGALQTIMSDDDELASDTIPKIKAYQQEILKEVDEIRVTDSLIMSEMQLEIDHLKHKMVEAGIDVNNGETSDNPIIE